MIADQEGLLTPEGRALVKDAADATFLFAGKRYRVGILVLNEEEMQEMNRQYRGKDSVTDVLSFPAVQAGEQPQDGYYGDILLCPLRARAQAEAYGHSVERELAFLTVHGALHLLGYDHETPEEEALMRQAQSTILERMGQAI